MDTKKALAMLSKGEKVYETHSLGEKLATRSAEYLEQYNERDVRIHGQQQSEEMVMPFLQSLRQKVATLANAPDEDLAVVTRFDLYTGIRKISERSQRDIGLKRLTAQLERTWHDDPMGSLSFGQVKRIVRSFKDDFPRSQASNAVEAECARIGLHKLPVAKLARIASKITSQADYDVVVRDNKLDGDKIEQVRARTFIRSLVSMNTQSPSDRIASKLAQLDMAQPPSVESRPAGGGDLEFTMKLLEDAGSMAETMQHDLDQASMDAFDGGLEDAGQQIQDLSTQLEQWVGGLTDARTSLTPGPDPRAPAKPPPGKPAAPPLSPDEEQDLNDAGLGKGKPTPKQLSPEEQDIEDAGMGKSKPKKPPKAPPVDPDLKEEAFGKKKLLDPRTWFAAKGANTIRLAKSANKVADLFDGELGADLRKFAEALNAITGQLAPMKPPMGDDMDDEMMDLEMPLEENMPGEMDMGDDMGMGEDLGDGSVQAPELEQGMGILEEIDEMAQELIEQAPPEAMDYVEHELSDGHSAPPGTAEWGAEEILNEGHEYAPPTEGWLQEEEQELGLNPGGNDMPMPEELGAPGKPGPTMPPSGPNLMGASMKTPEQARAAAWKVYKQSQEESKKPKGGKGIPLPKGKIKQQQEVTTYAKMVSPDGGKTLKASEIEEKLLDGKTLKLGEIVIRINANDEVELWENKDAGRACSLMDIDVAIADFMAMTGMKTAQAAPPAAPAAPAAGGAPQPNGPTLTATDIQAALQHYKSMGMGPVDAISMLKKDYKERAELETPEMQTQILGTASGLWTSGAPAAPGAEGAPAEGGAPELPAPVSMAAARYNAQSKMKTPSIRKPKDHVSVPKDLGEDSQGNDLLPSPGKINQSQGKPQGKLSPTDLGTDSEGKDLLPSPGKPKTNHSPTDQAGTALPDTNLGEDTEGDDPFKTPGLGSAPSPRKQ